MSTATAKPRSVVREALESLTGNGKSQHKDPTFHVEHVTPAKAAKWMERNLRNRVLRKTVVAGYAADMRNDRWMLNGETIKFDHDGNLLDGQHRLAAIIESGRTIVVVVARNVTAASFATMDQGVKRVGGDHFTLLGEHNAHALATACGHVRRYERGDLGARGVTRKVTGPEMVEVLDRHPKLRGSVTKALRASVCGSIGLFAFLHYVFAKKDARLADWFMDALGTGEGLRSGDAVYRLRERLIRGRAEGHRWDERDVLKLAITAWNKHRAGEDVVRLVIPESFPTID